MILEARTLERFQTRVGELLGLRFDDDKLDLLKDVLSCRVAEGGYGTADDYLRMLQSRPPREELGILAEALTVTETYFFRNNEQFRALVDAVIPLRMKARAASRSLRILSAGCASGEEAFAIAMVLLHECPALHGWDVKITGADVNPAMLAIASKGLYSSWSMRATSPEMRADFFHAEGDGFRLREDIHASVAFEARNFCEPNADLWEPGAYDAIFCRNMIMYLNGETVAAHVARMSKALAPGAFLFLGYAETLRGRSLDLSLCNTHGSFYYQRLQGAAGPVQSPPSPWAPLAPSDEPIQRAPEAVGALASGRLDPALDLLKSERYTDALGALEAVEAGADSLLLGAVLLTHLGRLDEAQAACERLLQADDLNAGAHYILALCREQVGDLNGAEDQDRRAADLDASFAFPWLHRGLLARRQKKAELASQHLQKALDLLQGEPSSRLLLFGGGFGRNGLAQLCRNGVGSLEAAS